MRGPSEAMVFAASRFPAHADEIVRQWTDPDIREICEHMQFVCRSERHATESAKGRFTDLRTELEDELLALLQRNQERSNNTRKGILK